MKRILCLLDRPLGRLCLEHVREQTAWEICGVVSRPDGGEHWWGVSEFADVCRVRNISWFDHARPLADIVSMTQPDVIVSVLFAKIVPGEIVRAVKCFNLHCAPLPAYRGFNSTLWGILNEETRFGATLHEMDERPDAGGIVEMDTFVVPFDATNLELYRLAHGTAYEIFVRTLPHLYAGDYRVTMQTGKARYYAKEDIPSREVALSWPAAKIARFARAFCFPPFDPAYVMVDGLKLNLIPVQARP